MINPASRASLRLYICQLLTLAFSLSHHWRKSQLETDLHE